MTYLQNSEDANSDVLCSVMSTIHYFDIFRHPLREDELLKFIHYRLLSTSELSAALQFLVANQFLFEKNGYYLPEPNFENINRRQEGEFLADKYWEIALQKSNFISKFPFVRSVLITGSLSKGFIDEKSDIDYLIITKPGRLWMTRFLLVLYKKLLLLNSHKFFCVNYFLDLHSLVLNDRNLFTATELLTAKPSYNPSLYHDFLNANQWSSLYYPGLHLNHENNLTNDSPDPASRTFMEKLLDGKVGNAIESFCMKLYNLFLRVKFRHMGKDQFQRDMKSTRGVSKHHPNGFRDSILTEHQNRMRTFKTNLNLDAELEESFSQSFMRS